MSKSWLPGLGVLEEFGLSRVAAYRTMSSFRGERGVAKAETDGEAVAVRWYSEESMTSQALEGQARLMREYALAGLPVPKRLAARSGLHHIRVEEGNRRGWVVAETWLEGSPVTTLTADLITQLGESLGKAHSISATLPWRFGFFTDWHMFRSPKAPPGGCWENASCTDDTLDELGAVLGDCHIVRRLRDVVKKTRDKLETLLPSLPMGPVHGDLFDNNALVDANGTVVGIVDFHVSGDEVFVNELAGTAAILCYGSQVVGDLTPPELLELYLRGYQSQRMLSGREAKAMSLLFSLIVPFGSWRREELVYRLNQNPNGAGELAGELLDEIEKMGAMYPATSAR